MEQSVIERMVESAKERMGRWLSESWEARAPEGYSVTVDALDVDYYTVTAVGPKDQEPVALVVTLGADLQRHNANVKAVAEVPTMLRALAVAREAIDQAGAALGKQVRDDGDDTLMDLAIVMLLVDSVFGHVVGKEETR